MQVIITALIDIGTMQADSQNLMHPQSMGQEGSENIEGDLDLVDPSMGSQIPKVYCSTGLITQKNINVSWVRPRVLNTLDLQDDIEAIAEEHLTLVSLECLVDPKLELERQNP